MDKKQALGLGGAIMVAVALGAYFLGTQNANQESLDAHNGEPKNLEEITKLESNFDRQQVELTNRVADVQNQIKTVKLNLGLDDEDRQFESAEIVERLAELDAERLKTQTTGITSDVPIPADSPDGKVLNQSRTASGMSQQVLQNYEKETGVSPDEIEELMRRTE